MGCCPINVFISVFWASRCAHKKSSPHLWCGLLFLWLASGYSRFASLIPARFALGTRRLRLRAATIPLAKLQLLFYFFSFIKIIIGKICSFLFGNCFTYIFIRAYFRFIKYEINGIFTTIEQSNYFLYIRCISK
jgi:hypothetical protein